MSLIGVDVETSFDIAKGDTQCVIVVCHPSIDRNLVRAQLAGKFTCEYVVISAEDKLVGTEGEILIVDDIHYGLHHDFHIPDIIDQSPHHSFMDTPDCTKKRRDLSLSDGFHTSERPHGWYNKFNRSKR